MTLSASDDNAQLAEHSRRPFWLLVISLWLAEATGAFETAMIYAAQRTMTEAFGSPVLVGWLVTSYLLIGAGAAALAGRLGDIFGRRAVMLIVLVCALGGSLLSGLAENYSMVLAGRCLQGLTGAILPLCIGLTREKLPEKQVPLAIGLMISGASAGTAGGLVVGGLLNDNFGWQAVFLASAAFSACAAIAILFFVSPSERRTAEASVDWKGGMLFVPGIIALLLAITYAPAWGLLDTRTICTAAFGMVLLAVWVKASLTATGPLFDVRLFARRDVAIGNAVTALVAMSALQITLVFSQLLQAPRWTGIGLGVSATLAGLIKLPSNLSSLAGGPLSGWITTRFGGRCAMVLGGALCVAGWLLVLKFHATEFQVMLILILISFGTVMLFSVGPTIIAAAVPTDRTGEAVGMMSVVRQAAMGVGAQIISVILASETVVDPVTSARFPTQQSFITAIWFIIALCSVATLLAFALPRSAGLIRPASEDRATR